jgi:lactate dehydrogenase-like 2-hydroxyacid dehydrogenase
MLANQNLEPLVVEITLGENMIADQAIWNDSVIRQRSAATCRLVVASHIASASARAMKTAREPSAQLVLKALRGEKLENVVNGIQGETAEPLDKPRWMLEA